MRIDLCGGVRIAGATEARVPGGQAQVVLAYLVSARDRSVPRSELAEVLWEDALPASWDVALRGIVRKLRMSIEVAGLDARGTLAQTGSGYQLVLPAGATVDVETVATELAEAQRLLGSHPRQAAERASAARRIASRTFVPGCEGAWLDARRAELRHIVVSALEVMAQAHIAERRPADAVSASEEAVVLEPFRESAYRLLMSAHVAAGNRAEALRAYERCRALLAGELGVDPSDDTQSMYLRLLRDDGTPGIPAPLARRQPGFVGRGDDLRLLREAWDRSCRGQLGVVLVAGEPGVGKTRLAAELAAEVHAGGGRVLYGRCDREPFLAYQPFVEAFGPLAYEADDRHAMFENVCGMVAAGDPTLLVVDDVHWADVPTLALLRHLVRTSAPLLLVLTYREPEARSSAHVAEAIASLRRDNDAATILLEGLSGADIERMIAVWAGHAAPRDVASELHARTSGNPFFVQEFLRLLAGTGRVGLAGGMAQVRAELQRSGVPERIREVILERVRRLGPHAREVLGAAAVLGPEFDIDVLDAVVQAPAIDAIDAAMTSRLVQEASPGRVAFAHALVRDALLDELSAPRRTHLHVRAAEVLDVRGGEPASVAHHYLAAGTRADQAADASVAAAQRASEHLAFEDAAGWYEQALPLVRGARACQILLELGDARWRAGDLQAARDAYLRATAVARELGDAALFARAALAIGPAVDTEGMFDPDVVRVLEDASRTDGIDDGTRARILVRTAQQLRHGAEAHRLRELCAEGIAIARRTADDSVLAYAMNSARHALAGIDDTPHAEEIIAHAERAGDRQMTLEGRNWRVIELLVSGDLDHAAEEVDRITAEAAALRQPFYFRFGPRFRAAIAACRGDDDAADRWASQAWDAERRVHSEEARQHADARLLAVRWQQGRLAEMAEAIGRWTASDLQLPHWRAASVVLNGGDVDLPAPDLYARFALALYADAAVASGGADPAARVYEALAPSAGRVLVVGYGLACIGAIDRWLGSLARVRGDLGAADQHLRAALDTDERMGAAPAAGHDRAALRLLGG